MLRAEGVRAVWNRTADRLREERRRRSFVAVPAGRFALPAAIPVLNLLSTPPLPRLGGLQAQLLSRIELESARRPVALLYPQAGSYRLEISTGRRRQALDLPAGEPRPPLAESDPGLERVVREAADRTGARVLHVEGLASLPLASLLALQRSGFLLLLSVHDFSLFCLRPHLLELPQLRFCGYSRDRERCLRCLRESWPAAESHLDRHRQAAGELLAAAAGVTYPSEFLRRRHLELFPGLDPARQRVIEPSLLAHPLPDLRVETGRRPVRRVAFIGNFLPHKGAQVFTEVLDRLSGEFPRVSWSVYGGGDADLLLRLRRRHRVRVRGYYRAGTLPALLRRDRIDLALLLSVVPESYSLALSECLEAGVPALAFDHGAIAERLARQSAGPSGNLLVSPGAGASGVTALLREVLRGERSLPDRELATEAPARGTAEAFAELYRMLGVA